MQKFTKTQLIVYFTSALFCFENSSYAKEKWPRLEGDIKNPGCLEALEIAKSMFYSDSFYISTNSTPALPKNISSKLALELKGSCNDYAILI